MSRTDTVSRVAANTAAALRDTNTGTVAQAADIPASDMDAYLTGSKPFTLGQLAHVSGFLRFPMTRLVEGT